MTNNLVKIKCPNCDKVVSRSHLSQHQKTKSCVSNIDIQIKKHQQMKDILTSECDILDTKINKLNELKNNPYIDILEGSEIKATGNKKMTSKPIKKITDKDIKKGSKKLSKKGSIKGSKQTGKNTKNTNIEPICIQTNSDGEETILNMNDFPKSLFENPTRIKNDIDMINFLTNKKSNNNNLIDSEFDPNDDNFMQDDEPQNNELDEMQKLAELTQNDNLLLRRMILKNEPFDKENYQKVISNSHKLLNYYLKHDPIRADILKDSVNFLNKLMKKHNIKMQN